MNKDDIVAAAFRAWGREGYRKMSLSDVASELAVTKPALYRHFRDKEVLMSAMEEAFFDRYCRMLAASPGDALASAFQDADHMVGYAQVLADYFGRNRDDLAFLFGRVMNSKNPEALFKEAMLARGVSHAVEAARSAEAAVRIGLVMTSTFFLVGFFHLSRKDDAAPPSEDDIQGLVADVRGLCSRGLAFPSGAADVDYAALDALASLSAEETVALDGLLPAVAAVVAEVGSWNASMDMVAKRSGLSKSGLYAHFKSKEDMLGRMFLGEFERISAAVEDRVSRLERPAEKLYAAVAATASYLLARPDVLVALDWVRTQRLGVGELMPAGLMRSFAFLDAEAAAGRIALLPGGAAMTLRWILFLTIHQLVPCRKAIGGGDSVKMKLRTLHFFLLNGLGGCQNESNAI